MPINPNDPLKHVNINIPESKHYEFKVKALDEDMTMQEVVEAAIDKFLKTKAKKDVKFKPTTVRIPEDLHALVRQEAFAASADKRTTFDDVVNAALTEYLD